MAFNINAQVVLSGPKNLGKVTKSIQSGLNKAGNVKIQIDTKSLSSIKTLNSNLKTLSGNIRTLNTSVNKTQSSLNQLGKGFNSAASNSKAFANTQSTITKQTNSANKAIKDQTNLLGKFSGRLNNAVKSAAAFSLVSGPIFGVQRALSGAVKDAVAFQKEIVKISQVTGDTVNNLSSLTDTINRLSVNLGVNANELAETARIIAQTGRRGKELEQILDGLAKSTLAASFGDIKDTTEGVIAAFGQFNLKGKDTEAILGGLNQVSKDFAVEAEDLVSVIRRAGGVFAQSAGQTKNTTDALFELNAIFTAVRSNTRESADTIAAGLRTIFSRIQRRGTIEFLKEFNIELTNLNGEFVGQFEAFRRLSDGLDRIIKQGDALTLSAIAEELGGIRQIGKLLPAIANFEDAQKALASAQKGAAAGLSGDVAKALDTIDARVNKVKASFNELIRSIFESSSFQSFAKTILSTSEALLKLGTSIVNFLEPVLPILTAIGAVKLGGFIGRSFGGIVGGVGTAASGATGQTSAKTAGNTQRTASNTLKILSAINTQTSILKSSDNTLRNINSTLFKILTVVSRSQAIGLVGGTSPRGRRRRADGGIIPKFADGGPVYGPSHAAGGVIAELEGGEYVIPKKFARGGKNTGGKKGRGRRAYVFDFDDTLAVTGSSGKELFSQDPELAASRQAKIRSAKATSLASAARKRSQQGFDVHVLTARFGTPNDEAALQDFLVNAGIKPGRTIFTGGLFKGEREPGKRPGTTRNLSTASKKARILEQLAAQYDSILFLDDAIENVLKAKGVKGVKAIGVDKQTQKLKRAALGGLIKGYRNGNKIVSRPGRREEFEAETEKTLRPGEDILRRRKSAARKEGAISEQGGSQLLDAIRSAERKSKNNPDTFGGIFLRPGGVRENLKGFIKKKDIQKLSSAANLIIGGKGKFNTGNATLDKRLTDFRKKFNADETDFTLKIRSLDRNVSEQLEAKLFDGVIDSIENSTDFLKKEFKITEAGPTINEAFLKKFNVDQTLGNLFEGTLNRLGSPFGGSDKDAANENFDFPKGLSDNLNELFQKGLLKGKPPVDAKTTVNESQTGELLGKVRAFYTNLIEEDLAPFKNLDANVIQKALGVSKTEAGKFRKPPGRAAGGTIKRFANGGEVPVRISNGELVITDPKEVAANKGTLQRVNKLAAGGFASGFIAKGPGTGRSDSIATTLPEGAFVVNAASTKAFLGGGFANGGVVQRFVDGGGVGGGSSVGANLTGIQAAITELESAAKQYTADISAASKAIDKVGKTTEAGQSAIAAKIEAENALAAVYEQLGNAYDIEEFAKLEVAEAELAKSLQEQAAKRQAQDDIDSKTKEETQAPQEKKGPTTRSDLKAGKRGAEADIRFAESTGDSAALAKAEAELKTFDKALKKSNENIEKRNAQIRESFKINKKAAKETDKKADAEEKAAKETKESTNATAEAIEELGDELNINETIGTFSGALTGLSIAADTATAAFDDGKLTFGELIAVGTALSQSLVALQAAAKLAAAAQAQGGIGGIVGARLDAFGASGIGKSIQKGFLGLSRKGGFVGKAAGQFGRTSARIGGAVGAQTAGGALAAGAAFVVAAPIIGTIAGKIIGDATSKAINNAFGEVETAAGVTGIKGETATQAGVRGVVSGTAGGAVGGALAGAGIGAAVGSIIPGIGTAIGAAAGAGIGAVIGASSGAIAGAINGPLEQAAFEAGIGLRESVESLSKSFEALQKNINSVTLREFNEASQEVNKNFFNTVAALQDFTNNAVSFRNATSDLFGGVETDLDVLTNSGDVNTADLGAFLAQAVGGLPGGAIAGQLTGGDAFKGVDQFFGTQLGRTEKGFKRLAENFDQAATELGDITQRLKESNEALAASVSASFDKAGLDLSAFDNIDLSAENADGAIKAFNTSLKASADSGNIFAQRLQEQQQIFKQNQVTFKTAAFAQQAAADGVSDASDVAAGRLSAFAVKVNEGEIDPLNQQQVDEFLDNSFGVFQSAAKSRAEEEIKQIQKSIKEGEQAAIQQGVVNGLLKEAQSALNDFIAKTKESADELAFAASRTNAAFANAASDLNALSGGATSISARQQATGVGQGKAGLDARQAFLERGGTQLGVDTSNIQGLDAAFTDIDEVAKEAITGLKNLGDGATVTADQVSDALVSGLEERIGKKLPKNLEQSIGSGIKAFSRQLGNGANIPVEELEQALEEGRLDEVLGPQAAAFQEQTNKVIEAMAQLEQSVAQLATLELESLTITRKNNAEEVKRLAANKKAIRDINKNLVGKATEAVDIVEEARNNVNNEAAALSGIGTSDPKELLAERARAQSELDAFRRGEGTEGLSAVERATEEARLTNQVNATTDALKLLATDTTQLAAIQEKLNQALQQRQQLESGVTGILDTAFQGPGALNQFGFEAASLAGTGALSDQATDQFQFDQQSNAEIRQLINNLNDPRFAAAVDAQGRAAGEEGSRAERVRLQAVQQLGERFRSSQEFQDLDPAGQAIFEAELDGLLEVDKTIEQLSKEANDLLKIQNFILAEIAAQDGKNREAIIAQAREAVAANEQVVKNEIQKLNELAGTDETVQTTGQRAEQLAEKQLQVETALQLARQKQADLENQGFLGFGGASQEELDRNAAVIKSLEDDLGLVQEQRRGVQGQAQARLDTAQTKLRDFEASIAAGTTGKTAEEEQRTLERLRGNVEQAQFTASSLDGPLASPTEIVDNSIQGQVTQGIQDAFAPVTEDLERIFDDTFGGYIKDFNETVSNINAEFNEITESISSAFQGFTDTTNGLVEGFSAIPESINLLGNISLLGAEGLAGGAVDGLKSFISNQLKNIGLTSTADAIAPGSIGNNQNLN